MKAAILTKYDKHGKDLLIQDIPVPVAGNDEVLVKIMAAAVNPLDDCPWGSKTDCSLPDAAGNGK